MAYISVAVEVDPAAITQEKVDALQERIPGLVVQAGHVLYFLLEVTSERDAINAQLLTEVTDLVWDTFGAKILRVPRRLAIPAVALTTWTRTGTTGALTVPAGTGLSLSGANGDRVAFQTRAEFTFAPGDASSGVGEIEIIAVSGGEDANSLQADPQADETLIWLDDIVVEAPTAGGSDEEDVEGFRDRVSDVAASMARTLIRPDDFEREARGLPLIWRALAIDNYDPGPPVDAAAPGHITVAVMNATGADPGSTARADVLAALEDNSLTNLVSHVIAPTETTITVVFAGVAEPDFDIGDVETRAEQAVLDLLDRSRWGLPRRGDQRLWRDTLTVRRNDVITAIESVDGFDHLTSLTINGSSSADATLTGPAGVPGAGSTASGTVTAP